MEKHLDLEIARVKSALLEKPGRQMTMMMDEIGGGGPLPQAAVCLLLRPDSMNAQLVSLFIKRRVRYGDPWSGHVALPGGRFVESDRHLLSTVIREVLEETGIDLRTCSMLGTLDELLPGNRAVKVTPYVALAPEDVKVATSDGEVSGYAWIPISFFADKRNSTPFTVEDPSGGGQRKIMASFPFLGDYVVWGMTLRVIEDFIKKIGYQQV